MIDHRLHKRKKEEPNTENEWLLTYNDTMTLLLVFFVLIIGISNFDINLWDQLREGLRSEMMREREVHTPLAEVKKDIDSLLVDEIVNHRLITDLGRNGITLSFSSETFYLSGEAELLPNGKAIVTKVYQVLDDLKKYKFNIDVEGHTDNVPINTPKYPSNWYLSVARASEVIQYFIKKGYNPEALKASGFADSRPLAPHKNENGTDIIENRAKNRRIVIRIYY